MSTAFLIFLAFVAGLAVTLQGQFMGLMDRALGTRESIFITYAGGGLIITLLMLATGGGNLKNWQGIPWYAFGAGILYSEQCESIFLRWVLENRGRPQGSTGVRSCVLLYMFSRN